MFQEFEGGHEALWVVVLAVEEERLGEFFEEFVVGDLCLF